MKGDRLRTAVVDAGYVGLATAVGLAEGRTPFHEPGLPEAYATQYAENRIVPVAELPKEGLDLIVVRVGTPIDDMGYVDVSNVLQAPEQAIPAIAAGATCVIRSTLPVGSAARLAGRPGVTPERLFVAQS